MPSSLTIPTKLDFVIWTVIIAGTVITLAGVLMHADTFCSTPPALLYSMCVDPRELMVIVFGTFFMIAGSIALLAEKLGNAKRNASAGIRKGLARSSKAIIVSFLALIIGGFLMTTSLYTAEIYSIYRTKIPLHVELEGIKDTYSLGEGIDFAVSLEGYGYDCGFPNVLVEKLNADQTMTEKVVWQLNDGRSVEEHGCGLFPVDVPKQVVHIGAKEANPLIFNETGAYLARIEGNIGIEFRVLDVSEE